MTLSLSAGRPELGALDVPLLVVALGAAAPLDDNLRPLDATLGGALARTLQRRDFRGARDETLHLAGAATGPRRLLLIGLGTAADLSAATYYVVHHITVQTTLFLAAGLVERQGGTTSINRLGGMLRASPVIGVLFFIPMLSLGGIPPFSGFLGKLALFEAGAEDGSVLAWVLIACGALVSLLTLYALARAWNMTFWRDADEVADYDNPLPVLSHVGVTTEVKSTRSIPRIMVAATAAMVALSVALTVFAGPLYDVSSRAGDNIDGPGYYITVVFTGVSQ